MPTLPRGDPKGNGTWVTLNDKVGIAPRFWVEVDADILASFTECSGLSATIRTDKWENGGDNHTTLKFPARTDYANVTLKRGFSTSEDLFNWFKDAMRGKAKRKSITIKLLTTDLQTLREWQLAQALPVKWTGPNLQVTSNTAAIEAVEFIHEGFL